MANSIEINNDTILKLIVRSGTDAERQAITLDVGELGYTTDHKRLYVGDSITSGGNLVGNVFNGARTDITSFTGNPEPGDFAFNTDTLELYSFEGGDATNIDNWLVVGAVNAPYNTTLSAVGAKLTVGSLSAYNISNDALGNSLEIDDTGRVTLSSTVSAQNLIVAQETHLSESISISGISYTFPHSLEGDGFLRTNASGGLQWYSLNTLISAVSSSTLTVGDGLKLTVDGNTQTQVEILTSGEFALDTVHTPASFCVFQQSGAITRQFGIDSIVQVSRIDLINDGVNIRGYSPLPSNAVADYPGATGAYKINFTDIFNLPDADMDVEIKNGSYSYTSTYQTTSANPTYFYTLPALQYGYYFVPRVGSPGTFESVIVYFYADRMRNERTGDYTVSSKDSGGILTPGYSDTKTRFKIMLHADKT